MEIPTAQGAIVRPVMPELDSIRGLAILLVFWFHAFEFLKASAVHSWERVILAAGSQGWAGVNLFFVLSGFLITGILLDSLNKPDYCSRFYYRRALRILPAYYLVLVFLVVLDRITFMPRHTSLGFVGLSFVYLSNVTPLLGVPMQYGPLWSLAVEEHFYILWPTAVRRLTRQNLVIAAAAVCVIEPLFRAYAVHRGGVWWGPYTWLAADGLALGSLLAIFARSPHGNRRNLLRLVILAAIAAIAGMAVSVVVPRFVTVAIRGTCVNYFAFAAVGGVLWLGSGPHSRLVRSRLLSFYGFISYGLYLIHVLCLDLYDGAAAEFIPRLSVGTSLAKCSLRFLIVLVIATAIAHVSRIWYEEFFLRMKDKRVRAAEQLRAPA